MDEENFKRKWRKLEKDKKFPGEKVRLYYTASKEILKKSDMNLQKSWKGKFG